MADSGPNQCQGCAGEKIYWFIVFHLTIKLIASPTWSCMHLILYIYNDKVRRSTLKHRNTRLYLFYLPQQQGGNQILNWGLMHQYSNFTNHWKAKPVVYMLSIEFTHSADTEWYDYPTGWYTCHSSCAC